jgi:peptidoglycan/LPS O-acetylase OafA/YrhL
MSAPASPIGTHIPAFDGLRGFAAILVFLVHYATLVAPWIEGAPTTERVADLLHGAGNVGVDLFFLLSGYFVYGALTTRGQSAVAFWRKRFVRIYPAFLAVFGLYLVLSLALPQYSKLPDAWFDAALYVKANLLLLPGLFPIEPVMTVAWSLSYFAAFYLAAPGLVALLPSGPDAGRRRLELLFTAIVGVILLFALFGGPVRLIAFLIGAALYEVVARVGIGRWRIPATAGDALAVGGFCIALSVSALWTTPGTAAHAAKYGLICTGLALAVGAALAAPKGSLVRLLSAKPILALGVVSYSYFLIHGLALKAGFALLPTFAPPGDMPAVAAKLAFLPIFFLLTIPPAALLYRLVERPAARRLA